MNSRLALLLFSLSLVVSVFGSAASTPPGEAALDPAVPFCGHLSPSGGQNFSASIEPQCTAASFKLEWRPGQARPHMTLHSPRGENETGNMAVSASATSQTLTLTEPQPGEWRVQLELPGDSLEGSDYCLTALPAYSSSRDRAYLNGIMNDWASKNEEGQVERMTVYVGVNVMRSGNYSIAALARDQTSGEELSVSNSSYLGFGSRTVELNLINLRSMGRYLVHDLALYDEAGERIDVGGNYTTRDYSGEMLENQSARLTGRYLDHGEDTNGDGLYDLLVVDAGILVLREGNFSLMGSLYDATGKEIVWTVAYGRYQPGLHTMHMDFDGKTLELARTNGPYLFANATLLEGDSRVEYLSMQDIARDIYTTGAYNYSQFVDPVWPERTISGSGSGELLLTIVESMTIPTFDGRYSLDIVGANMPPLSSNWTVSGSKTGGYSYDLPGVHMPGKPNDFIVQVSGVKSLNVGVRKDPVKDGINTTRAWISEQAMAGPDGVARVSSDLISPGRYHFKVFGEAAENASLVEMEMTVIKKLVIRGDFSLALNTSGFPDGDYIISAKALNGTFRFADLVFESPDGGL